MVKGELLEVERLNKQIQRLIEENFRLRNILEKQEKVSEFWYEIAINTGNVLKKYTDNEECLFDHHGYCQTHGTTKPCINEEAKKALAYFQWKPCVGVMDCTLWQCSALLKRLQKINK